MNLDLLYKAYPRKMGKRKGLEKLFKLIRTQEDYDNFIKAIQNYSNYIIESQIEPQFIMYFSTFVNNYEDWLDEDAGKVIVNSHQDRYGFLKEIK